MFIRYSLKIYFLALQPPFLTDFETFWSLDPRRNVGLLVQKGLIIIKCCSTKKEIVCIKIFIYKKIYLKEEMSMSDIVEMQYETIKRREKTLKTLKNLSVLAFLGALLVLLLYPCFIMGEARYSILDSLLDYIKEEGIGYEIAIVLEPITQKFKLSTFLFVFSLWYVAIKLVVLVFLFVISILKFLFGGFFKLIFHKELTYQQKEKIVEKYRKKNSRTLLKGVVGFIISNLISLIFPTISDLLQLKDDATSFYLPLIFSIMFVVGLFIPFSSVSSVMVMDATLVIDMLPITIAMVCGVLHTVFILVSYVVNFIFKRRKI